MLSASRSKRSAPSPTRSSSFRDSLMNRLGLLLVLSLAMAVVTAACGDAGFGAPPKPTLAPTSVEPTFVRIAVTPRPTSTPVPTVPPTPTREPGEVDFADPVFPDFLDPELAGGQPDDETIFAGWTEHLTNTSVSFEGAPTTWHLCADGVVLNEAGLDQIRQHWRVDRSPATSSQDWGTVSVMVSVIAGRWEGREFALLTLNRKVGKIFVLNTTTPGEVEIKRSKQCHEL